MLKTTKTVTIKGTSSTDEGRIIATMNCTISDNLSMTSSENIADMELYKANTNLVRADMDAFTAHCRSVEDELRAEKEATE